jgi:hypothetical protein
MSVARTVRSHRVHSGSLALGLLLSFSLVACSQSGTSIPKTAAEGDDLAKTDLPELEGSTGPVAERQSPRRVGDVFVHRFSGSYRHSDLTLREEVIAQKDDTLLVDFLLDEHGKETHLRVTMSVGSERILSVTRVQGDDEVSATLGDFEKMMAKTSYVPDSNTGRLAEASETCLVGKQELDCDLSEYKVIMDGQEGTLKVARNDELKRDISGEITAVDGTLVYRAELIEMQRGQESPSLSDEGVAFNKPVDLDERD